jgi:hypothetical protein
MPSRTPPGRLPGWLKTANRLMLVLQHLGLPTGTIHLLTLAGRSSGFMRITPVSLLTVGGARYIVSATSDADWVKNARAAGWGILDRGRRQQRVTLSELPVEERASILREFPRLVPGGVGFFRRFYTLPHDRGALPAAFADLAESATVFLVALSGS